ncbi:hypothetical protein K3495_g10997 [Podosphaera aphanis]|nr:hypothetical protein K3495_g10997 [Podosphaera aphanis]
MAEVCNDIPQAIMKKVAKEPASWPPEIQPTVFKAKKRELTNLFHSPYEIQIVYQPYGDLDFRFQGNKRQEMLTYLLESKFSSETSEDQCKAVFDFVGNRENIRLFINKNSRTKKEEAKERYDRRVTVTVNHTILEIW